MLAIILHVFLYVSVVLSGFLAFSLMRLP